MTPYLSSDNKAVYFQKGDERLVIWTNNKDKWTFTDMRTMRTRRYTKELAMALAASLADEGYEMTHHD
jgi:hypothetical protein